MNQLVVRKRGGTMVPRSGKGWKETVVEAAVDWTGKQMISAIRGIASAYRANGNSRAEMSKAVAPLAVNIRQSSKTPKFRNVSGGISLTHTEALVVTATTAQIVVSSETFGWLRNLASGFEEYRIKMEIGYAPICPATTTGVTMLAFDYDPVDTAAYDGYQDYFNTADHCISSSWAPAAISPKQSGWLKTGTDGDVRLYSPGVIQITQTATTNGYFMVRYSVDLRKPQPVTPTEFSGEGTFSSTSAIYDSLTTHHGNNPFVFSGNTATQVQPGKYVVFWSTDANMGAITTTGTAQAGGFVNTTGKSYVWFYSSGMGQTWTTTWATVVGGATAFRVSVCEMAAKPIYTMT